MQIDRLSDMDKAQTNYVEKTQKVQETVNNQKVDPNEQYKKSIPKTVISDTNEVILDNVQFGYNKKSQDFFIKVTRGETEQKYPTDEMMKLKAHLIDAMRAQQEQQNRIN